MRNRIIFGIEVDVMKRIFPLILTVLLLPALLAVPARAEDIGPWLNVLDFSTANGSGSNFFNVTSGQVVEYDIPGSSLVTSVDLVVYSLNDLTGVDISRNGSAWQTATVTDLGDSYYRITLDTNRVFQGVYMRFFYEESGANTMQVISLKVAVADMAKYYIPINGTVYDYASSPTKELSIIKNADNLASNTVSWFPNNDTTITYFRASLPLTEWYKYDKIHIVMSLYSATFDSIDVTHSGYAVPYEYNLIENTSGGTHIFYIDLVIDVSEFDRAVTSPVTIQLSGTSTRNNDSLNKLTIYSALGVIEGDTIDPITYWFTSLQGWLTDLSDSFSSAINSHLNSLIPLLTDWTEPIPKALNSINNNLIKIKDNVTAGFNNLPTWISEQTTAISNAISTWGQNIVDAIIGTGDPSDIQTGIDSAVGELNQAGAALDAVQRPDIGKVDINIVAGLDPAGLSGFASIVSLFTGNSVIYSIMMMFVTLSLISFILFGKG